MFSTNNHFTSDIKAKYSDVMIDFAAFHKNYASCVPEECEQLCCAIGGYLTDAEYEQLHTLISNTETIGNLTITRDSLTEGYQHNGIKQTALKDDRYCNEDVHFDKSCVYKQSNGYCSLQVHALEKKEHPWTYKPFECWIFPLVFLNKNDNQMLSIMSPDAGAFNNEEWLDYPKHGACIKENSAGTPGYVLLKEELLGLSQLLGRNLISEIEGYHA